MYDSQKYNNNHLSHYYSLAQQFQPKRFYTSVLKTHEPNYPLGSSYQQTYTFSKDFYSNKNINSAYRSQKCNPKYRSSSLPSQCLVRNLNTNHFFYYDQLKRRDFIVTKNCRSSSDLMNRLGSDKEQLEIYNNHPLTTVPNADLKRFSKFDSEKKLIKSNIGPFVRTNVKVFNKPDQNNKFTQIKSSFQPLEVFHQDQREIMKAKRQNQVPMIDCSIEVKSDEHGRYYSTVQNQHPAILTNKQTIYDKQNQIFTTEATLIRQFSYSFSKLNKPLLNFSQKKTQNPFMQYLNLHKKTKYSKQFGSFIIKGKKTQLELERKRLQKLKSPQVYRKNKFEYQNLDQNNSVKNENLKYHYSKYFLEQKETKNQYRNKIKSARKDKKSERKQIPYYSLKNHNKRENTTKNVIDLKSLMAKQSFRQFS